MMRMVLIHDELWEYVESDKKGTTAQKQKALAKIAMSVTPAVIPHIRTAKSAFEAWNNLQKAYEGKGLSRRLGLLRTLFATKLSECESMEAYVNKITEISQQLSEIGSPLDDDFVAVVMLSGLPSDYDPMIMALENSNVKLSSEVVKGKLLQENLRRDEKSDGVSALVAQKKPRCFRCKKVGHVIKDCPKPGNKKNPKPNKDKILLTALSANFEQQASACCRPASAAVASVTTTCSSTRGPPHPSAPT
uniref:CCHC-type domain-containing protein n=1 Tax=Heliothis virescens TaxID=7102 RepID=A0A2A4JFX6_HELVI